MPMKMTYTDDEGKVYLIIDKKILYAIIMLNIIVILLIIFLGFRLKLWISLIRGGLE